MKVLVFPQSWRELSLVPTARSELLAFIEDVAQWNGVLSRVRLRGTMI